MTLIPQSPAFRRRAALALLVVGGVLVLRTVDRDLPREQTVVFRLAEDLRSTPLNMTATLTRAGDSEPQGGFSLTRTGDEPGDPRKTFRARNGDYLVTVDWNPIAAEKPTGDAKPETSTVHRVTLAGGDIVVPIGR
jgi:hypothetical protein